MEVYPKPDFIKPIVIGSLGGLAFLVVLTAGLYKVKHSSYCFLVDFTTSKSYYSYCTVISFFFTARLDFSTVIINGPSIKKKMAQVQELMKVHLQQTHICRCVCILLF